MIKVFLLLAVMSSPGWPSVKSTTYLYDTESSCRQAQVDFLNAYEMQSQEYKNNILADAYCLEFKSFLIPGFNKTSLGV